MKLASWQPRSPGATSDGARALLLVVVAEGWLAPATLRASQPWSIAELRFDEGDFAALKEWWSALDAHRLAGWLRRTGRLWDATRIRAEGAVSCEQAFGLVALALAAESVRRDGGYHDAWRAFAALPCDDSVRNQVFRGTQPSTDLKDAFDAAAIRFGLRRGDGTGHHYYQTLMLQLGVPGGSLPELPRYLETGVLPDSVRSLRVTSRSFERTWGFLEHLRRGPLDERSTRELLDSPWLPPNTVTELSKLLAPRATADAHAYLPLARPVFDEAALRFVARPQAFDPGASFAEGTGSIDLFATSDSAGEAKLVRYLRDEKGRFTPVSDAAIELRDRELFLELRSADGTRLEVPTLRLWDDDEPVVLVRGIRGEVLLVDCDDEPELCGGADCLGLYEGRWAIQVGPGSRVELDGATVWASAARGDRPWLELRLERPFDGNAAGELALKCAAPWAIESVKVDRTVLSVELDETGRWSARGPVPALADARRALVSVVLRSGAMRHRLMRRVALRHGAWLEQGGAWFSLDADSGHRLTTRSKLHVALPETRWALLDGDRPIARVLRESTFRLSSPPLGLGECLWAWDGSACARLVSGPLFQRLARQGELSTDQRSFRLDRPLDGDPTAHRILVWTHEGALRSIAVDAGPLEHIELEQSVRAAALFARGHLQAHAWSERWFEGETDPRSAMIAVRSMALPLLLEQARDAVMRWVHACPSGFASIWLPPEAAFAASDAARELLEAISHARTEDELARWFEALRQIFEPWASMECMADSILDALRNPAVTEGEYSRACRRLLSVGPRSTLAFLDGVRQAEEKQRRSLKTNIVARDLCGVSGTDKQRARQRAKLEGAAALALSSTEVQVAAIAERLRSEPTDWSVRTSNHIEAFRTYALAKGLFADAQEVER